MRKSWVRLVLVLVITGVFLYFFFRSVDWKEVYRHLSQVHLSLFILVIILSPLHLVTRAWRWRYLLLPEKRDVRFWSMFAGNAVGFAVNFSLPGRVGELVKPLYLAQKEKIRAGFAIGTVVVERIFDMFTMCFLLGVFLLARPLYASRFNPGTVGYSKLYLWGIVGVAFASALLLISLALYFFREKTLRVISFLLRPFPQRFSQRVILLAEEFIRGLKFFRSRKYLFLYTFFSFVVWLGIIFYYWVFFLAFGIKLLYVLLLPYVFLTMVGASIPTPGMVGGFHWFSKVGLTLLYGIDTNLAVGVTIVVHAVQVVMTCSIGYAILWKEGMSILQIKKLGEVQTL